MLFMREFSVTLILLIIEITNSEARTEKYKPLSDFKDMFLGSLGGNPQLARSESINSADSSDFGAGLISSLRNDANLDLPVDEEYEDLRAQLFAYHSALASLAPSRRSMLTTPCWRRGGICISYKLCPGHRQLSEVPGCKNRHNVCCFVWNQYEIRELKDQGINNLAFPWNMKTEYGGQGVQQVTTTRKSSKSKKLKDKEKIKNKDKEEMKKKYF